jgi:hypothetical protein
MQKYKRTKNGGYGTLMSVLFVSAVAGVVTVGMLFMGTGTVQIDMAWQEKHQAVNMVDACVQYALLQIRDVPNYTGTQNKDPVGRGVCQYTVSGGGTVKTIEAIGDVGYATARGRVVIDVGSPIGITSWEYLADF